MMSVEESVEWELAGETDVLEENCPSATLSTTNPAWRDPGSNPAGVKILLNNSEVIYKTRTIPEHKAN
jgi:hypothetical protein